MTARKFNAKLANRIAQAIVEEPRRFVMGWWIVKLFKKMPVKDYGHQALIRKRTATIPPCGTAGCIAGHAVILVDGVEKAQKMTENQILRRGAKLLGVSEGSDLFRVGCWPNDLREQFDEQVESDSNPSLRLLRRNAKLAVEAIRRYAKAGGSFYAG